MTIEKTEKTANAGEKSKMTDIQHIRRSVEQLKKHLLKNKHDFKTKRTLSIKAARLRKLEAYIKTKES